MASRFWNDGPVSSVLATLAVALGGPRFDAANWRESWELSEGETPSGPLAGLWLVVFGALAFAGVGIGLLLPPDSIGERIFLLFGFFLAALALVGSAIYGAMYVFGAEKTNGLVDFIVLIVATATVVLMEVVAFGEVTESLVIWPRFARDVCTAFYRLELDF